jgi:O-antigen ligase
MMGIGSAFTARLMRSPQEYGLFGIWAGILLFSFALGIWKEWYFLAGVPVVVLLIYLSIVDVKKVFLLLMASIPLSTEVVLPNGFGTDLPTEPLMVGLMLLAALLFFSKIAHLGVRLFKHPITILLLLHLFWVYFSTFQSDMPGVSLKFSLAKTWYVVVFYFLAFYLLRTEEDIRKMLWWVFWPLIFTVAVILLRHSASGFAFDQVHKVLHPFQRNHVSYAATLALFIPFIWYLIGSLRRYSFQWWGMVGIFLVLLVATYLTYTRAAYLSLVIAVGSYFIFRFRLIRFALLLGIAGAIAFVSYLAVDERYLDYAPNYDTTIMHTEFGSLLEATTKGEDISTMERVHRWVAAVRMSQKSPWLGYGPGNFVHFYEPYTVNSFKTYVSRNEERSGVHSYFLLLLVEQGWPGLVFFLGLSFWIFIRGETIYHVYQKERAGRLPMAILLVLVVIYSFLIINDMIETDKVGSYFFLCLAMLVRLDFAGRPPLLEEPDSYEQEK